MSSVVLADERLAPATLDELRDLARTDACRIDGSVSDLRPFLKRLADLGVTGLGLPGDAGTLRQQASATEALGEVCMASAFTLWAHRMAAHYVALRPRGVLGRWLDELRGGVRPGSTAMAGAFRDAAGIAELPVTYHRVDGDPGGSLSLTGSISWASNLYDDAIIVTAARDETNGERIVVAFRRDTAGVSIHEIDELLALGSTKSGSLRLDDVRVPAEQIITTDFAGFIPAVRAPFLVLQSSFCLGLAAASLDAAPELRGVAETFADDLAWHRAELERLRLRLAELADAAGTDREPPAREYLELRLGARTLARTSTQLELCLAGGRGYLANSPTARRLREALFLPVQSPTEGQLRWELSLSA